MAYVDNNTPVIEKITLPSGNSYWIADREIRDVVDTLSQTVAGGVSYNVGWDGTSAPTVGNIPEGVTVEYNGQTYTGTLDANNATPGAFYLVKSATQTDNDVYDEYVPVGDTGSKTWELIGNTQAELSDLVTDVSLTKQTDTVIGTDATFTITQPTITLTAESASATGRVGVITELGTPSTSNVASSVTPTTKKLATTTVTGVSGSTTPSVVQGRTSQTTATGGATASTTNTDWLKGVSVTNKVLTFGAATPDTQTTYSANAPAQITVPTAATSATTVATGAVTASGSGADVVTDVAVGDTVAAVTGYASPTTKYISGSASGANTQWNSKDSVTVLKNTTDVSVTKG